MQKSFDVAAMKYPWLNDYREKAVTELEFLHGHLRDPGKRAACFFFRDKVMTLFLTPFQPAFITFLRACLRDLNAKILIS